MEPPIDPTTHETPPHVPSSAHSTKPPYDYTAPEPDVPPRLNIADRLWLKVRPYAERVWVILRVWAPILATPIFRERQVVYPARDHRESGVWHVVLPRQCSDCGRPEVGGSRQFEATVRNFESPVAIAAAAFGSFIFFVLAAEWLSSNFCMWLAIASLAGGAVFVFVKSWSEDAQIVAWGCDLHLPTLAAPDLVPREDELHVLVPSPKTAAAARVDLEVRRRSKVEPDRAEPVFRSPPASRPAPAVRPSIRPGDMPPVAPPQPDPKGYRREELPPIKLDE
ncbi:MAG TPA: hypothetical protein VG713_10275 [Pirellulales bacterium]|nr:hypothetical protein [Pirellulales bacterium]